MAKPPASRLPAILSESATQIIADWLARLNASPDYPADGGRTGEPSATASSADWRRPAAMAMSRTSTGRRSPRCGTSWPTCRAPARFAGFSPTETATFILSLKQPLFARLRTVLAGRTGASRRPRPDGQRTDRRPRPVHDGDLSSAHGRK